MVDDTTERLKKLVKNRFITEKQKKKKQKSFDDDTYKINETKSDVDQDQLDAERFQDSYEGDDDNEG